MYNMLYTYVYVYFYLFLFKFMGKYIYFIILQFINVNINIQHDYQLHLCSYFFVQSLLSSTLFPGLQMCRYQQLRLASQQGSWTDESSGYPLRWVGSWGNPTLNDHHDHDDHDLYYSTYTPTVIPCINGIWTIKTQIKRSSNRRRSSTQSGFYAFFWSFIPRNRFTSQQYASFVAQGENHPFLVAENLREIHSGSEILTAQQASQISTVLDGL